MSKNPFSGREWDEELRRRKARLLLALVWFILGYCIGVASS